MNNAPPPSVGKVQIVATAIILSPVINLVVCGLLDAFVLDEPGGFLGVPKETGDLLFFSGLFMGVVLFAGAHLVRRMMEKNITEKGLIVKMRLTTVSMMIGETGSIFGLVFFLLTGRLTHAAVLMAMGCAAAITLFPSRSWLLDKRD